MSKQILVRNIPDEVENWIDIQRSQYRMSQQEFVVSVLRRVSETQLPLFPRKQLSFAADQTMPFKFVDLFAGMGKTEEGVTPSKAPVFASPAKAVLTNGYSVFA